MTAQWQRQRMAEDVARILEHWGGYTLFEQREDALFIGTDTPEEKEMAVLLLAGDERGKEIRPDELEWRIAEEGREGRNVTAVFYGDGMPFFRGLPDDWKELPLDRQALRFLSERDYRRAVFLTPLMQEMLNRQLRERRMTVYHPQDAKFPAEIRQYGISPARTPRDHKRHGIAHEKYAIPCRPPRQHEDQRVFFVRTNSPNAPTGIYVMELERERILSKQTGTDRR